MFIGTLLCNRSLNVTFTKQCITQALSRQWSSHSELKSVDFDKKNKGDSHCEIIDSQWSNNRIGRHQKSKHPTHDTNFPGKNVGLAWSLIFSLYQSLYIN